MKNIIFILAVSTCILFSSCSETETNFNDENITQNVKISGVENDLNRTGGGVGFAFEIGRKSQNCTKVGICRLVAVWIVIVRENSNYDDNVVQAEVQGFDNNQFIQLQLDEAPSSLDTSFYIDEDLVDDTTGETIFEAGVYPLDGSIGSYGGYTIPIKSN